MPSKRRQTIEKLTWLDYVYLSERKLICKKENDTMLTYFGSKKLP